MVHPVGNLWLIRSFRTSLKFGGPVPAARAASKQDNTVGQAVSLPNCGLSYFQVRQADRLPHESIAFRAEHPPHPRCHNSDSLHWSRSPKKSEVARCSLRGVEKRATLGQRVKRRCDASEGDLELLYDYNSICFPLPAPLATILKQYPYQPIGIVDSQN